LQDRVNQITRYRRCYLLRGHVMAILQFWLVTQRSLTADDLVNYYWMRSK